MQKIFLQKKLYVKIQTSYAILLTETSCLILQIEVFFLTIIYICRMTSVDASPLPLEALRATQGMVCKCDDLVFETNVTD